MSAQLTTFTLSTASGEPTHTLCRGHVSLSAFQRAMVAEGWTADAVETVAHEWWKRVIEVDIPSQRRQERWEKTEKAANGALPVTVSVW